MSCAFQKSFRPDFSVKTGDFSQTLRSEPSSHFSKAPSCPRPNPAAATTWAGTALRGNRPRASKTASAAPPHPPPSAASAPNAPSPPQCSILHKRPHFVSQIPNMTTTRSIANLVSPEPTQRMVPAAFVDPFFTILPPGTGEAAFFRDALVTRYSRNGASEGASMRWKESLLSVLTTSSCLEGMSASGTKRLRTLPLNCVRAVSSWPT